MTEETFTTEGPCTDRSGSDEMFARKSCGCGNSTFTQTFDRLICRIQHKHTVTFAVYHDPARARNATNTMHWIFAQ